MVNNVIRSTRSIKGRHSAYPQFMSAKDVPELNGSGLLVEQFFGRRAVSLGPLHMRFDPGDFGLQRLDPLLELVDRHGVEVLPAERDERIVGLAGEEVFQIHDG